MSDTTKSCNLTEAEIRNLISHHGCYLYIENIDEKVERIKYLHGRLKSFAKEADPKPAPANEAGNPKPAQPSAGGWPS